MSDSDSDIEEVSGHGTTEIKENNGAGRGGSSSYDGPFDKKVAEYVTNLLKERDNLDADKYPLIHRLVQNELSSISKGAVGVGQENGHIDLYGEAPITLYVKAMPPSKIFPKVNFAGRIIGPKGTYLKALMKETMTKMTLLGKGVMKDKNKEEQLRRGSDPKYYHLNEDMHVAIQVTAPAPEAYAKVAYALKCLREQALSDNQGLEELPWITNNVTRNFRGGAQAPLPALPPYAPVGNVEMRLATGIRHSSPPPFQLQQSSRASYPPQRASYDSPPELPSAGQHSHSPSKTPYYTGPSYTASRWPAPQSESLRAMDHVDKALYFRTHWSHEGIGSSSGARPDYEYEFGHTIGGGRILYDQQSQKPPQTERVERSSMSSASQLQRYAPY